MATKVRITYLWQRSLHEQCWYICCRWLVISVAKLKYHQDVNKSSNLHTKSYSGYVINIYKIFMTIGGLLGAEYFLHNTLLLCGVHVFSGYRSINYEPGVQNKKFEKFNTSVCVWNLTLTLWTKIQHYNRRSSWYGLAESWCTINEVISY